MQTSVQAMNHTLSLSSCLTRFLQRCPLVFLSGAVAPTVIQCALAATTINHRDAFTSVMKFHRDLIRLPENPDLVSLSDNYINL